MNGEVPELAVGGGDALVNVDPLQIADAVQDLVEPTWLAHELPAFIEELARIGFGVSDVEFPARDARFADPAWRDNPLYRRLGQSYLAWCGLVGRLADNPRHDWRRRARAEYTANILTAVVSPTNLLPGNPAALKRAFETGGASLLRGARHLVDDVLNNGGMPRQVDASGFTVGENLAATPGAVVYREEMFELLQYSPSTPTVFERPLLMVPPEVNKHYFLDLAPGRSLVEYTVQQGITFFTIVWRNPRLGNPEHGAWDMEDYVTAELRAIDIVRDITGRPDVNVFGACAGGLTTALLLGHLAATKDDRVHAAAYVVTMIDTREPSLIRVLGTDKVRRVLARDRATNTVYDSRAVASNFAWMRANDLVFNYVVNNWLMGNDPPVFDILAWNADSTNLSSAFDRDLIELYAVNAAATPGGVTILDTPIDLSKVECDTFIIAGKTDHITPWKPCYLTSAVLGGQSEVVVTSTGHIQTIVNPPGKPRARYFSGPATGPDPDAWMAGATEHEGSWWPHWADWLTARSGERRPAKKRLGSRAHPAGDPAPGRYVLEK